METGTTGKPTVLIGSMVGTTYYKQLENWQLPYALYHQYQKLSRSLWMIKDPTEYFIALAKMSLIEAALFDIENAS